MLLFALSGPVLSAIRSRTTPDEPIVTEVPVSEDESACAGLYLLNGKIVDADGKESEEYILDESGNIVLPASGEGEESKIVFLADKVSPYVYAESIEIRIATPADGPSFSTAPSPKCRWNPHSSPLL